MSKNKKNGPLKILWKNREVLLTLASFVASMTMWYKKMMKLKKKKTG